MVADHDDARPDPDALLAAQAHAERGRLKIFLGAAPGVGKTWEMLTAARQRHAENPDVLIGIVETHGRAETAAQIGELPVLPRRTVAYRGQTLEEFDLDAALARHPSLLLMDELAHTNAPGSRHHKRWEDVRDLLNAGIDVWATLNVQHLDSLNDAVARITGVRVQETLPDSVLNDADEIELVDLPPAELRGRLEEGRIYRSDVARRALDGFFREGNLAALREMALRRTAQHVDADVNFYMRAKGISGPWPAGDRVLAMVGPDAAAEAVVRHASRIAQALSAPLIVLHVERPDSGEPTRAALDLAERLGAEVETTTGSNIVATALDLAKRRNVTHIVLGRAPTSSWRRPFAYRLSRAMLRAASDFTLDFVPLPATAAAPPRRPGWQIAWPPWLGALGVVAAVTALGHPLSAYVSYDTLGMVFLAGVVTCAVLWGLRAALPAAVLSFLAWNFFFIPPRHQFTIHEWRDGVAIVLFMGVALATGALASRVRGEARAAQSRVESLRRIGAFSRSLGEPTGEDELLREIVRQAATVAGRALLLTERGQDLNIRAAEPHADTMDEAAWAAARWAYARQEPTGRGSATLPSTEWRFLPLRTVRGCWGVLGVRPPHVLAAPETQTLATLADQAAVAMERVRLIAEAARIDAQQETQKLRTALLSSLSHDLRTPLAGIRGAAETLRTAWDRLDPAVRADLLGAIEADTGRMTRFLANILDMTRLETGEIIPHMSAVDIAAVVDAALGRVPGAMARRDIPILLPHVVADHALLEQVIVNVLDNAVKYGPPGAEISIVAGQQDRMVELRIADNGPGIPADDLPQIFDSFYRARRGDRTIPGTGLGLAIAQGLMTAMGGDIAAHSPRHDAPSAGPPGTEIVLRLPVAP
jgi:two-component system, OmpR family, sensor histidine kinase KdpD